MADQETDKRAPAPNAPPAQGGPAKSPTGSGTTGKPAPFDVSKYRTGATSEPETAQPEREQFPLLKWSDLGGIDGLSVDDVWTGTSKPKTPGGPTYEYTGANVRFPDGAHATVLTGVDTVAGQSVVAELRAGRFDKFNADGSMVPVPVHVRNRPSKPQRNKETGKLEQGKPMSFLTFG